MTVVDYTERQRLEKRYHDEKYARPLAEESAQGRIKRAFRRYWEIVGRPQNLTILDFGCGEGWLSVALAKLGNRVQAFDISEVVIERARQRAQAAHVADLIQFTEMAAEDLSFSPESFDLILGNSILHHTDLNVTLSNIRRVLKPNGKAIFLEPLNQNIALRTWRMLTPWRRSETERALTKTDLAMIRDLFPGTRFNYFCFASLFTEGLILVMPRSRFVSAINERLEDLDEFLVRAFPSLGRFSAVVVLEMQK